ncbi:MAG: putative kinase [Hyphomicrobiaceae bacterium]|jgi:predicted kinase
MRHLILLRGAPGVGKSTFIERQGLKPYAISPDEFRLRLGGVVMTPEGGQAVSHAHEKRVWSEIEDVLDFKMGQGQFVVFDATFQRARDFSLAVKLAERHRYQVHCIDFSGISKELAHERNKLRDAWKVVPDHVIDTAYTRFVDHPIPKSINRMPVAELDGRSLIDILEPPMRDLTSYAQVMHIGDLQGCYAPVAELFADGFRDDTYYIFIGDLLDRGIQNGECIRFAVDEILPRANTALVWGNHEYHIHRFAKNLEPVSREFKSNTLPQIEAAKFTKVEANALMNKAEDAFTYRFHDRKMLVTHAGLSRVPERLVTMASQQFWKGTGTYDDPVDAIFANNELGSGWAQVHGHRNSHDLAVEAAPGSFNLEAQIEFGGHLRVMSFVADDDGVRVETREIKNDIFRRGKTATADTIAKEDQGERGRISEDLLAKLESHTLVKAKGFVTHPHVRSLNFTRDAFFKGNWDDVNIMARGLFVADDRRIVARSYPKFFNLEERVETQTRNLRNSLEFPLKLWVKENGYLGILGWDHVGADLFYASKSTPESDFAGWFREIFDVEADERGIARARDVVNKRNLTLVFEVNDPVRDPHMIAYEKPHVVLLDAILREEKFARLPYEDLKQIATMLGVAVKQPGPTFRNWKDFQGWLDAVQRDGRFYQWRNQHVEGFVAEDLGGYQFKIKLDYYSFWKWMRTQRDRVRRSREKAQPLPSPPEDHEGLAFYEWLIVQSDETLQLDIIQLRNTYEAESRV